MPTLLARSGCWLLLALLAMAPVARAAESSAHLCRGELRLSLVKPCCCPPQARAAAREQRVHLGFQAPASPQGCCELKASARTPDAPAPFAERVLLEVAPLTGPPPAVDAPLAILPVVPASRDSRMAANLEQATAAPLYLQLRHWLI